MGRSSMKSSSNVRLVNPNIRLQLVRLSKLIITVRVVNIVEQWMIFLRPPSHVQNIQKKSVAKCDIPTSVNFTGFTSIDEVWDFQTNCGTKLTSSDGLCSVQYDSVYGYPKEIFLSTPNVLDGAGVISVKNFHVDD